MDPHDDPESTNAVIVNLSSVLLFKRCIIFSQHEGVMHDWCCVAKCAGAPRTKTTETRMKLKISFIQLRYGVGVGIQGKGEVLGIQGVGKCGAGGVD